MPELRTEKQAAKAKQERRREFEIADHSFTVDEFCVAERIGRSQLYKQWREGRGPRYFLNGSHRRISHEARIEWRHRMEAEAATASNKEGANAA